MAAVLIILAALALVGSLSIVWLLEERARVRRRFASRRAALARRVARRGGGQ